MAKLHKLPRLRLSHGQYFWVPSIDGKQKWQPLGKTYAEALVKYAQYEAQQKAPKRNIEALLAQFKVERYSKLAIATRKNYDIWGANIIAVLGAARPDQIKYSMGVEWLRNSKYKVTGQREMQLLCTLLNYAREIAWLDGQNPLAGLRKGERSRRKRYITDVEWTAILANCDPRTAVAVKFARLTSARREDFMRLLWSDMREDGISMRIQKTKQNVVIKWTQELRTLIEAAKALRGRSQVTSLHVFAERDGSRTRGDTLLDRWKRAGAAAGVQNITLHDIRRKRITDVHRDHGLAVAQSIAVHSDPKTTLGYCVDPEPRISLPPSTEEKGASGTSTDSGTESATGSSR